MKNKLRFAGLGVALAAVLLMAQSTPPRYSAVSNVVYYKNPVTGGLGLYLSFELEENHRYQFQGSRNGVDFFDLFIEDTTGRTAETYESFNIGNPCDAVWPRIIDLGPTR